RRELRRRRLPARAPARARSARLRRLAKAAGGPARDGPTDRPGDRGLSRGRRQCASWRMGDGQGRRARPRRGAHRRIRLGPGARGLVAVGGPGLWATRFYGPPTVTWSSGVHAAVVEVDVETGRVTIIRYAIVHDCGRQLHPVIVDGQIVGGFAQGLGVVLGEHVVHDDNGQLLTNTLMDYPIPRADDMPPLVMEHLQFATDHNPLGVRGVGEGATGPPTAAIANA